MQLKNQVTKIKDYNSVHKNVMFNIKMQPPAPSCTWRNQQLEMVTCIKSKVRKRHMMNHCYHRWSNRYTVYKTCLHTNILKFKSGLQMPPVALVTISLPVALQSCAQDDNQPWHGLWTRRNELNKLQSLILVLCLPPDSVTQQTKHRRQPHHIISLPITSQNPLPDWIT